LSWLVRGGDVLATAEQATSRSDRLRGLWRRPAPDGALILAGPVLLHTLGVPYGVDVAFCDQDMVVVATLRLRRFRVARPRPGAKLVVVAADGAFERWRLTVGDELEIRGT
jgi:uncharacterized membrane protein (UPF0127 family)